MINNAGGEAGRRIDEDESGDSKKKGPIKRAIRRTLTPNSTVQNFVTQGVLLCEYVRAAPASTLEFLVIIVIISLLCSQRLRL